MAHPSNTFNVLYGCALSCIMLTLVTWPVSALTTTVSIQPESTSQPREGDAVTLRCEVFGLQPAIQFLSWSVVFPEEAKILTWMGELDSRVTDPVYSVVNNASSDPLTVPEVHNIVIKPANQSHNGMYTCRVLEIRSSNSYGVISSAQTILTVYPAKVFPTCSPSGAASLYEGSTIYCSVTANTTALVVTRAGSGVLENWASSSLNTGSGSQLTTSVTTAEDSETFNCSSVALGFPEVTLLCQIGPLSVTSATTAVLPHHTTDDSGESSTTVKPAAVTAGVAVAVVLIVILAIVAVVLLVLVLQRRRGRLTPSDKDRERATPAGASSPTEPRPVENGKAPPKKPVPYAVSKRHPSKQAPVVYASVQQGRGKVAPGDPAEGQVYAIVHREHEEPAQIPESVQYASVHKDRKRKDEDTEPAHYAAVNKLRDPKEDTEPAHYAAVHRNGARAADIASKEDGLVYAELDLANPPDIDNTKPIPKEEPTVYAELTNLT